MGGFFRSLALACAWVVATSTAQAVGHASIQDIVSSTLNRVDDDGMYAGRISGLPAVEKDAVRAYLLDLFQDEAFATATRAWAESVHAGTADELQQQWAQRYSITMTAGVALLSDADLVFLARISLMPLYQADTATCARMMQGKLTSEELLALYNLKKQEQARYFAILKGAYLRAQANEVPVVLPSEAQVGAATLRLLAGMAPAERQDVIDFMLNGQRPSEERLCTGLRAYASALFASSGDDGRLLRRSFLVTTLRAAFAPETAPAGQVTTEVKGAASGQFQPGPTSLEYPRAAAQAGIVGDMRVRIWVDERGQATRVKVIERKFNKDFVTTSDGDKFTVEEMFDPVVTVYYRAGKFMPRFKDGKAQPYVVEVPISWALPD